jgi:hypothetical protein
MALWLVVGLAHVPPASADHLADFITDLYGGGGIFLPPAPDIPAFIAEAHQPHFTGESQIEELNSLSSGILAGTGIFALNSTVTGISFDLSTGVPQAVEDSLGPLLAERATTLGDGRLSFGFGYSQQKFKELDGDDLDDLDISFIHQDCCAVGPPPIPPPDGQFTGFEQDIIEISVDLKLEQEVYAFFGNYGVTDRLDIGVVVPIVSIEARASATAEIFLAEPTGGSVIAGEPVHSFESDPSSRFSETGGSKTGLGDVIVRAKYNFLRDREGFMDLSVLGEITAPTGNENDLLGTGETQFRGMLIASKNLGRITPHINVAYSAATSNSELEKLTYTAGFDARVSNQFTLAADVLGRHNPHVDDIGNNVVDLAVAVKWNPFTNRNAPLNAFVSFPLNDDGLRPDVIWGIGFDFILN